MLNVGRLRVLNEVARRGSFSAAADALSYTQSAVSQQIATLEAETGVGLLERRPRGVHLTSAGRALVEHSEGILARLQAAEEELSAIAGLRGGELRMASFPTAGAALMPAAIARFRASYPEVRLTLAEGEPEEIAPRLHAGEFDLALLFEFSDIAETESSSDATDTASGGPGTPGVKIDTSGAKTGGGHERLSATTGGPSHRRARRVVDLLEDPMFLALPREHRLARKRSLHLEELREEAWVQTSASSPCARYVVRCCHSAGFDPAVAFESDDYQTVQGLVASGVGVALIPELALSVVREDIVVRALSPHPPGRRVIAALPRAASARTPLTPASTAMLRVLEEAAAARPHLLDGSR
jgi:DNA-binding transcriptional LysR family regulator